MSHSKFIIALCIIAINYCAYGQAKGNYDLRNMLNNSYVQSNPQTIQQSHPIPMPGLGDLTFTIKGLYNVSADSYLAIFTATQVGKTQKETNKLLKDKIDSIRFKMVQQGFKAELFVDMISFIPMYEVSPEKKLFSKTTYNEIPVGFELKKNLHFKYSDPRELEALVTLCAEQEIYDLVRVDYFIDDIEAVKAELIAKAQNHINQKIARYGKLTNETYTDKNRLMTEGFAIHYPIEQYQSYQAYCTNALTFKHGVTNTATKATSQFYMPKLNKNYDFVINASMLEPVVQVEYEIKVHLSQKPAEAVKPEPKPKEIIKKEVVKEIFLITPDAKVQKLNL